MLYAYFGPEEDVISPVILYSIGNLYHIEKFLQSEICPYSVDKRKHRINNKATIVKIMLT